MRLRRGLPVVCAIAFVAISFGLLHQAEVASAESPPASLKSSLARAQVELNDISASNQARVTAGGVTANDALLVARELYPDSGSLSVYLGEITHKAMSTGGSDSPLAIFKLPVYAVMAEGVWMYKHGYYTDGKVHGKRLTVVLFVDATTGQKVLSTNI